MRLIKLIYVIIIVIVLSRNSIAQNRFRTLRFEENYEYLNDSLQKKGSDKLKWNNLGSIAKYTLGGELNQTFEYVNQPFADQVEDSYFLSRVMMHGSLNFRNGIKFYSELASGIGDGRNGGFRPIDEDKLYTLNLFVEKNGENFGLRIGRQELYYGGENLLSIRNGTNVRYTFDAARGWIDSKFGKFDAFYAVFVPTKNGFFDNPILNFSSDELWGVYLKSNISISIFDGIDIYYMGMKDEIGFYAQRIGKEYRHSIGTRLIKDSGSFGLIAAGVYQFGNSGQFNVSAYQLALIPNYQLTKKVNITLNSYLSSGDDNPNDGEISTFNPYYPQQASFRGAMATRVFPSNIIFVSPRIELNYFPYIITVDTGYLWRQSAKEGINIPGGFPSYLPNDNSKNYLGNQIGFSVAYVANKYLTFVALYSHFNSSTYIESQSNAGQVNDFLINKIIIKF